MSRIEKVVLDGRECYEMACGQMKLCIDPADGLNIFSVTYGQHEVVRFRADRCAEGRTYGIPILYPTPNRTRDGVYTFNGFEHHAEMHGLVKKHPFTIVSTEVTEEQAVLVAEVCFTKGNDLYEAFPYESVLQICIVLSAAAIDYTYTVENRDEKPLPYGFALHPFFEKLDQPVKITVPADEVMVADAGMLPTGEVRKTAGTRYDLHTPVAVDETDFDDVFTGFTGRPGAVAEYTDFVMELEADPLFRNMVVFTPAGQGFYCLENQTCSTDTVNMHQKGFQELANLQIVTPGSAQSGTLTFRFKDR